MKVNSQIIDYIRSGIHAHDFFNYDGHPLKLRPLRTIELDDAKINGYKYVSPSMAKLLLNIYIGKIDAKKLRKDFPTSMYKNFDKYYREIDYWIVYHGMKDFCDEDFSIDDVREMRYVHDIAKFILSMSSSDSATIRKILQTDEGKNIATIIHIFHQPLAVIKDLTPIQERFLYQSDPSQTPEEIHLNDIDELEELLPLLKGVL